MIRALIGSILVVVTLGCHVALANKDADAVSNIKSLVSGHMPTQEYSKLKSGIRKTWYFMAESDQEMIKYLLVKRLGDFLSSGRSADKLDVVAAELLVSPIYNPRDKEVSDLIIKLIGSIQINASAFERINKAFMARMDVNSQEPTDFFVEISNEAPEVFHAFFHRQRTQELGKFIMQLKDFDEEFIGNTDLQRDMARELQTALTGEDITHRALALEAVKFIVEFKIPNFVTKAALEAAIKPNAYYDPKSEALSKEIKRMVQVETFLPIDPTTPRVISPDITNCIIKLEGATSAHRLN